MRGWQAALCFLTVIPTGRGRDSWLAQAPATVGWYAPVGLLVGVALAAWWLGARQVLPSGPAAVVVVMFWTGITGGLHLDGLADTADAAFAAVPRSRRLEILQEVHHGTYALVAITLLLGLKVTPLFGLSAREGAALLVTAPLIGRAAILIPMRQLPAARAGGMAAAVRSGATRQAALGGIALVAVVGGATMGWQGVALVMALICAAAALSAWFAQRLGGLTGDVHGAVIEITEALCLAAGSGLFLKAGIQPFPWV